MFEYAVSNISGESPGVEEGEWGDIGCPSKVQEVALGLTQSRGLSSPHLYSGLLELCSCHLPICTLAGQGMWGGAIPNPGPG